MIDKHATLSHASDVLVQEIAGEAVLLDLTGQRYFGLNDVGTRIWQLIPEVKTLDAVKDKLLSEYDVDEAALAKDLCQLAESLMTSGLIEIAGE